MILLHKVAWATIYLDAWLGQACGLGQALSEADAGVRVGLEGGAQELHVFFGEAGPLPATGAARGAATGGHSAGIIWGKRREQISHQTGSIIVVLLILNNFCIDSLWWAVGSLNKIPSTAITQK